MIKHILCCLMQMNITICYQKKNYASFSIKKIFEVVAKKLVYNLKWAPYGSNGERKTAQDGNCSTMRNQEKRSGKGGRGRRKMEWKYPKGTEEMKLRKEASILCKKCMRKKMLFRKSYLHCNLPSAVVSPLITYRSSRNFWYCDRNNLLWI